MPPGRVTSRMHWAAGAWSGTDVALLVGSSFCSLLLAAAVGSPTLSLILIVLASLAVLTSLAGFAAVAALLPATRLVRLTMGGIVGGLLAVAFLASSGAGWALAFPGIALVASVFTPTGLSRPRAVAALVLLAATTLLIVVAR